MVSYIYTKAFSIFWIYTSQKILPKKKKRIHWVEIFKFKLVLTTHTGFIIIPRFLFVINQKILKFLVFTSWKKFRLTLYFRLWFGKFSFKFLENLFETPKLLSSPVRKLFWYLLRFYQVLFSLSNSFQTKYILYIPFGISEAFTISLYSDWISSNSYFERLVMFLPTTIWIKLRHFLHSLTACLYLRFSIYFPIGIPEKIPSKSFNRSTE